MKQFIIMATVVALSACNNNNSTNNIPRTYIPNYGECTCSSELPDNERIDLHHKTIYNNVLGGYASAISIPAYGFESYTRNMPSRANRLPFNYDDFVSEKIDSDYVLPECRAESFNHIYFKTTDYIQMIEELLNNDLFEMNMTSFGGHQSVTNFTIQGNFLEIEISDTTNRHYKYSLDLNSQISRAGTTRVRSNVNNCLHENYFFDIEIPCNLEINDRGNVTTHILPQGFRIDVKPDMETYEEEIVYKKVLTTSEFRSRLFKNVTLHFTTNGVTNTHGCPNLYFSTKQEVYN
jgi:hypothetical protein